MAERDAERWYFAIYRGRVCWIGLARRTPFPPGCNLLGPEGGRFAFGESREECVAELRAAVAA